MDRARRRLLASGLRIGKTSPMNWLRLATLPLLAALAGACVPPPLPPKKTDDIPLTDPEIDHDRGVDVAKARKLLARGEVALTTGDIVAVKRLCEQADPFADDVVREDIRNLLQRADKAVAKGLSPAVLELAKTGKCKEAAEEVAKIADAHRGTTVIRFVRDDVSKPILGCLLDALAIDVSVARELAETTAIKKALNPVDFDQWDSKLDDTIVGSLVATLQEPIGKRSWAKALEQLDDLVMRKEAGAREIARVMKVVRAGVAEDVEKKVAAGLGARIGAATLSRDVDALLALGRWTDADPMPEVLAERRKEAAFWTICAAQSCSLGATEQVWSFGLLEPKPALDLAGKPGERVKHARKLWKIADGRPYALVSDKDPGPLDGYGARIRAALGWVPITGLTANDPSERLPPGEAIVGTRVWGPLRDKVKEWEVGFVREASGNELTVERVSDGKMTKTRRADVKFGTLRPGTKVLALCVHPVRLEPAVIDEYIPVAGGDPHLKLTCLDDKGARTPLVREILLGTARTNGAWIPASP